MSQETNVIVVLRELDPSEFAFIQALSYGGLVKLYSIIEIEALKDESKSIEIIQVDSYDQALSDRELFDVVKGFGHKKYPGTGESIIKSLGYKNEFYPWYALKSPMQKSSLKAHFEYKTLKLILDQFVCTSDVHVYSEMDLSICFDSKSLSWHTKANRGGAKRESRKYFLTLLIRAFMGLFRRYKKNKIWIVNSNLTRQSMFELDGKSMTEGDPFLGYLEDEIGHDNSFQNILILKNPGAYKLPGLLQSIRPYHNIQNHVFFESKLVSLQGLLFYLEARKYKGAIKYSLMEAFNSAQGFDRFLIRRLQSYSSTLMLCAIRYEIAKSLIAKYRPRAIGGDDEFTLLKFPLFQAARCLEVPTYAIQHGGISLNNINYSFVKDDQRFNPLSTKTLVWGEMTAKQLCTNSIYQENQIVVVGQIRTDVIPALKSNKIEAFNSEVKTIVFASQPLPHDQDLRNQMFADFVQLNKVFTGQNILWKPHPNERLDIEKFQAIAEESGVTISIYEGDLYGLLAQSDVLITNYSTVGSEAVYFDKELLVLDYSGNDSAGYVKNGVGHLCKDFTELESALKSIIQGETISKQEMRQTYKAQRAYKIDGNVRFRIIDVINAISNDG